MIRVLRREEIDEVVPLLSAAYQRHAPFGSRLARYLTIEPEGWFVARENGQCVGMVGVVIHVTTAYIGLMAVHPTQQGKGLGRRLFEHALAFIEGRGVTFTMLDASEAGAPLYLKYGFTDRGKTFDLVYAGAPRNEPIDRGDVEEILALDASRFGADRSATLRAFAADFPERLVVARAKGRVVAYALAQAALIGPLVAEDPEAARAVVRAATSLPFDAPPHVVAPEEHGLLLESEGFRVERALRHMRLGAPEIAYRVIAKASMAVG